MDMKTNKIFKGLGLALVALATLATTSCKDEPDAYEIADGKPSVRFIRPVSAASRDSIITSATMQTTICLVGENLRSVTGINVWENTYKNVAHYKLNEDNGTIAGQLYPLSKGVNSIQLSRELPVEVNGDEYSLMVYIQAPYDQQPVIRDGDFYGSYYVDNCRLVPVGSTVATEVN